MYLCICRGQKTRHKGMLRDGRTICLNLFRLLYNIFTITLSVVYNSRIRYPVPTTSCWKRIFCKP